MRRQIIFPLIIIVVLAGGFWVWKTKVAPRIEVPSYQVSNSNEPRGNETPANNTPATNKPPANTPPAIPATLLLKVPFTSQAPYANWDELHNEACEEANALMAGFYFGGNNDQTIPPDVAEAEIMKLVKWENDTYGYSLDTTSAETAKMIEQIYGLKTKLMTDFTADDLKSQLNQNHLVLISTDGRLLNNPNFRRPGPVHHMLIIKGYNSTGIVTNDSGTRNGRNYTYDFKVIHNAAGDWIHANKAVDTSKKVAIIVWKE